MNRESKKITVGISIGDINGIGMEIILKTFEDKRMLDFCTPVIFGSNKILSYYRKRLNSKDFKFNVITNIEKIHSKKVNFLDLWEENIDITLGVPSAISGKYAFDSIKRSCNALKRGNIDVLVTAPISKSSIQKQRENFVGHTEFLEDTFSGESLMIMVSDEIKIACVTGHIPLANVTSSISIKTIIKTTNQLNKSLIMDFGIIKPKIAILGLNPHAGEDGILGSEEKEILTPAITQLKKDDVMVFGPFPADSFFSYKNLNAFDGVVAMYHDQGLIPFKTLYLFEGVNYTAGLDIIRTSPMHGTAYEIAGKDEANEDSFREAVFLACNIFNKRLEYTCLDNSTKKILKQGNMTS